MNKCNRCDQEIVWPTKFDKNATKRSPPNNKDGTPHRCQTETPKTESKGVDFAKLSAEIKTNPIELATIDLPHETKQKICADAKEAFKVLQCIEWQAWEIMGYNSNPAHVMADVKIVASKMLYVPIHYNKPKEDEDAAKS